MKELRGLKWSVCSKLGVNNPECAIVALVLGSGYREVLGNNGDLLHSVNVKELPAHVLTGFASTAHLVCPKGSVAFGINSIGVGLNHSLKPVIVERQ